jgi:hypothetical protein
VAILEALHRHGTVRAGSPSTPRRAGHRTFQRTSLPSCWSGPSTATRPSQRPRNGSSTGKCRPARSGRPFRRCAAKAFRIAARGRPEPLCGAGPPTRSGPVGHPKCRRLEGHPAARGDGPNRLRQGTNVCVSKPTHRSGDDRTIGEKQQYPSDHVTHLAPKVRTILNLIVAFRCACDGHCARAVGILPIVARRSADHRPLWNRSGPACVESHLKATSQCRAARISAVQRP